MYPPKHERAIITEMTPEGFTVEFYDEQGRPVKRTHIRLTDPCQDGEKP